MSSNYHVQHSKNLYLVIENDTSYVISELEIRDDAVKLKDFLNEGGGFDGFTPAFFTKKVIMETTFSVEE